MDDFCTPKDALPSYGLSYASGKTIQNDAYPETLDNVTMLSKRAVGERFTQHDGPVLFAAIGDSYTSGIGAGKPWDDNDRCTRNTGAYAPQLNADFPWMAGSELEFLACEGVGIDKISKQVDSLSSQPDFVVLTMGANDLGFKTILRSCIYGREKNEKCVDLLSTAWKFLYDDGYKRQVWDLYDKTFSKMPLDYHHQIYHIGYPNIFNYETEWCDDKSMSVLKWLPSMVAGWFGFKETVLSRGLRKELADLSWFGNKRLMQIVSEYIDQKTPQNGPRAPGWYKNRLFFLDLDYKNDLQGGVLGGHRFCEPGVTDTDFEDPSIWFFSLNAPDVEMHDGQYRLDHQTWVGKLSDIKSAISEKQTPQFLKKASHLRSAGHTAIKDHLKLALMQFRPYERFDESCAPPPSRPSEEERKFIPGSVDLSGGPPVICLPPPPG
ncbi:MAG: hypothetical protein M1831_002831 [Alyxoria varia]|nr:MAG: hypothetical protein M1831_002831 [Alyxoria varia]